LIAVSPRRVYQEKIMRKLSIPVLVVVVVSAAGCSFEVGSSRKDPAVPAAGQPAAPAPAAPAAPGQPGKTLGRNKPVAPGVTPPPATPTPAGIPVLTGTNMFGTGTPDAAGWKGNFYNINAGTTKLPTLANVTPNGVLFAKELNVPPKAMAGGFPGIDPSRNENFAIRWEAPLVVDNEADYTFRLVSDDGAIVSIDGTSIIENDGVHSATEKTGPVHLVKGTHAIAVDYYQAVGSVALQLFCKKAGGTETICPTHL
jgi:PA14 domain